MFDLSTLSPRERRLLRTANNIAKNGKHSAAEKLYRSFLAEFPHSVPGLLGLAQVVNSAEERDAHLNHVLEIEPDNAIATAALDGAELAELLTPKQVEVAVEPPAVDEEKAPPAPATIARTDHVHEPEEIGGLRCNKCNKPIDLNNSTYTAVGYRCNNCLREIEDGMYSASISTYIISFLIGLVLSATVAALLGIFLGGGFFVYLITYVVSSALGRTIGSLAFRAGGRNRGRYLSVIMSTSIWLGTILALAISFVFAGTAPFLLLGIFAFGASSTAYFRVR